MRERGRCHPTWPLESVGKERKRKEKKERKIQKIII